MSIKIVFNGEELSVPGVYSKFNVAVKGDAPLASAGIVGIVGEAEAGEPGILDVITRSQFDDGIERYKSGPIATAISILKAPSKDGRILGGASTIVIYKTNASVQAEYTSNVMKVLAKNWGVEGNDIAISIAEGAIADEEANILGTIDAPFAIAASDTLILDIKGTTYTYTAPALVAAASALDMETALNVGGSWAPVIPVVALAEGDRVKLTVLDSIAAKDESYMSVDAASLLDTILGIAGEARGNKGSRLLSVSKGLETESSSDLGGVGAMDVKYVGTGAFCKLSVLKIGGILSLKTDTGVPAEDIEIALEDAEGLPIKTFQALSDQIQANANYESSVIDISVSQKNATELDYYTDIQCENVGVELHRDMYLMLNEMNIKSELVSLELLEPAVPGALETFSDKVFLVGGLRGASTNTDFLDGFDALKGIRVNIALPLVSEDVGGLSVESINAMADAYGREGWTTGGKSERQIYVSKLGTKDEVKLAAQTIQSEFTSLLAQDVRVLNPATGLLTWFAPWAHACMYAGMQAGGEIGEPTTFKTINANNIRVRDNSWDPRTDAKEMIDAGVSVTRALDTGGFEIAVANTTYGKDSNWLRNRTNVMEAAAFLLFDLRFQLERNFSGTKARTGGAEEVKNFVKARSEVYLGDDITVGNDNNDGLGYRALEVEEDGNITRVKAIYTLVEGRDFILPDITFERNVQTA